MAQLAIQYVEVPLLVVNNAKNQCQPILTAYQAVVTYPNCPATKLDWLFEPSATPLPLDNQRV